LRGLGRFQGAPAVVAMQTQRPQQQEFPFARPALPRRSRKADTAQAILTPSAIPVKLRRNSCVIPPHTPTYGCLRPSHGWNRLFLLST
jgi:hypothetical protein